MKRFVFVLLAGLYYTAAFSQPSLKIKEADKLAATGSFSAALPLYKEAYQKDPRNIELLLKLANANVETINYSDALICYDHAITIAPASHKAHYWKGRLLNSLKMLDDARKEFSAAISIRPEGEYYYWRGIVYQRTDSVDNAMADYDAALGKGFSEAGLYNNYAILLIGKTKIEEALYYSNKAVASDKTYAQALSARAKIKCMLLDVDSACIDARAARSMGYEDAFQIPEEICYGSQRVKWQYAAELLVNTKMYAQAALVYSKIIDAGGDSSDYFLNRGFCFYKQKEYDKAEADYLKALSSPGAHNDLIYDNLSLLYYDRSDFLKQIESTTKHIELSPLTPEPYIDRGLAYRKLKMYKEAEKDFNAALAIKPDFFRAFGYRAFLNLELGRLPEALADAEQSVAIQKDYGYGYLVLGQAKMALGKSDFCLDFYSAKKYGWPEAEQAISRYCK